MMGQELQGSAGIAPGSKSFAVQFHVDFGIYCRICSRIRCTEKIRSTIQRTRASRQRQHYAVLLHHTATHCIILQHADTHGNTLQHTATYCKVRRAPRQREHYAVLLHHTATRCTILQHAATHCDTLHHTALQHTATHCNTLQHKRSLGLP